MQQKMTRKHSSLAVLAILMAGACFVLYLIAAPARAAAENLSAINDITVGQTTETDLWRHPEFKNQQPQCYGADCLYHLEAENQFLSRVHLARRTSLATVVKVREGLVTEVSVIEWREGLPQLWLHQVAEKPECSSSPCLEKLVLPTKALVGLRITFDSHSDLRNRIPQSVNSECFSRIGGCKSDAEFMPVLKEVAGSTVRN
jgi:hypothetical protein